MDGLSRREYILKLIVEHFIKTAEPVGSNTLIGIYHLPYSSATIRNEMVELEVAGYIEKTHTSSGRVPSSRGYRYYVDYLRMKDEENSIKNQIQNVFNDQTLRIEDILKQSCEIISSMTNLVSVVLGPDSKIEKMKQIQIVPLSDSSAVAIFVTDHGYVENRSFIIPEGVKIEDLESTVTILNKRIVGTPICDVIEKVESLKPIIAEKVIQHELLHKAFIDAFIKFAVDHTSVYGKANLLEHPEFSGDITKLKKLVSMFDDFNTFTSLESEKDIEVRIGDENKIDDFDDMSIVKANLNIGNGEKSSIALIGPRRMDYSKIIDAIEYLQDLMEKLSEEEKNND